MCFSGGELFVDTKGMLQRLGLLNGLYLLSEQ